jgi:adenylate cyclase
MTNYKFKHLLFFLFSFCIITFVYLNYSSFTSSFDNKLREFFFEYRGEIPTTNNVAIIDIDEKSINALGQWPFSRDYMAQVLVNLTNAQVGVIGMDIIFSEQDRSSPSNMAKILGIKGTFQNNDVLLGEVIANTPTILGYFFTKERVYKNNEAPSIPANFTSSMKKGNHFIHSPGVVTNIPAIQSRAYSSGFFNAYSSDHGKITKMPLVLSYQDKIYPSLTLEMIRVASQSQNVKIIEDRFGIKGIQLNNLYIPTDANGFLSINFRGAKNSFKYFSFVDILDGNFDPNDIAGKFVLIGTSAITLADLRAMVYDLAIPGVEIHANIIDNILQGDFLYQHASAIAIDTITIFCLTLILGAVYLLLNALAVIPIFLFVTGLLYSFYYYLLFSHGIIVDLFYPLVSILTTTIMAVLINYIKEQKQKDIIKNKFSKKVSGQVVEELLKNKEENFESSTKEVTVFFSDIRSFTKLSEKFQDPQKVISLLNTYMEPMVEKIIEQKGTIDKFIGDAIMAYWNAPQNVPNHEQRAVQTALHQIEALDDLNQQLKKEFDTTLNIGIGIHTGKVTVGEMGSSGRSDYTIIGDNVNLASRIEGLTKYFDVAILVTQSVYDKLDDTIHTKKLCDVIVQGKENAITVYEVLTHNQNIPTDYYTAVELYENQQFQQAKERFEQLQQHTAYKIQELYINECEYYLNHPQKPFLKAFKLSHK